MFRDANSNFRDQWLREQLAALPKGIRILDAGAGGLAHKDKCSHLDYVSQDHCQYDPTLEAPGMIMKDFKYGKIDIVSDICSVNAPDQSFDALLCSEVLVFVPDPLKALDEFSRLLKPGGKLILTAPYAHPLLMAPQCYYSGFTRYWYQHHLSACGFSIRKLDANGEWFGWCDQELLRLGSMARKHGDPFWLLPWLAGKGLVAYRRTFRRKILADDELACYGWLCVAEKI